MVKGQILVSSFASLTKVADSTNSSTPPMAYSSLDPHRGIPAFLYDPHLNNQISICLLLGERERDSTPSTAFLNCVFV